MTISFGNIVVKLDFLVVEGSNFVVIIGDLTTKDLQGVNNIEKFVVKLTKREKPSSFHSRRITL